MRRTTMAIFLLMSVLALICAPAAAQSYQEAPMLADAVKAGTIPALTKRLPESPLVLTPYDEIGKYGGAIRSWTPDTQRDAPYVAAQREELIRPKTALDPVFDEFEPNLATAWEFNDDYTAITIHLRQGVKWSNGDPFTSADVAFAVNDIWYDETLAAGPPSFARFADGGRVAVATPDAYTVVLTFPEPTPLFLDNQAEHYGDMYAPSAYLKKFHPKYNKESTAAEFEEKDDSRNLERPTLGPFVLKDRTPVELVFERNPYYWKVDPKGNQLPYADEWLVSQINQEVAVLHTINGNVDFKVVDYQIKDFPVLKENESKGDYKAYMIKDSRGLMDVLEFNYDSPNPKQAAMFRKLDFRIGVSHAIDREEIIENIYFGLTEPKLIGAQPGLAWNEKYNNMYLEYAPDLAKEYLAKAGLKDRNGDGWLDYPDGETFEMKVSSLLGLQNWEAVTLLVVGHLKDIGIKAVADIRPNELIGNERSSGKLETWLLWVTWYPNPFTAPRWFDPAVRPTARYRGVGVHQWFQTGGKEGREPTQVEKRLHELAVEGARTTDKARRKELAQELSKIWAENVWSIGLSGQGITPLVVHNRLGNVPAEHMMVVEDPAQFYPHSYWHIEQWYLKY